MAQNDAPNSPAHGPHRSPYKRVMLKLGGEMFGGGKVGVDPDVVDNVARQIAEVARPAGNGSIAFRLHGHARHRDELPGPSGLP